jgi:hypothetical protein
VWLEIIAYVWRTYKLPVIKPSDSKGEVEGKQLLYYFSARQYMCIERMKMVAGHNREEDWLDGIASDDDSNGDDDDRLDKEQEEVLEGHVLQFMLLLLDYVLGDSEYKSALISGMAVLGISAESR